MSLHLVSCHSKYPIDFGKGYKLDYDGNSLLFLHNIQNNIVVKSHILRSNFDSNFIIVEQKPWEFILKDTFDKVEINIEKRDLKFEQSDIIHYWIINKNNDSIYGPFEKEQYVQKQKKLKIQFNLK